MVCTWNTRVVKSSRLPAKIAPYIPGLAAYFDNSAAYFKTF